MSETSEPLTLDALLARLVDETISREEVLDLERRLENDPKAQRRYLHYLALHTQLSRRGTAPQAAETPPRLVIRSFAVPLLTICSLLILIAGLLVWQVRSPSNRIQLTAADGPVQWTGDGMTRTQLEANANLPPGTLETLSADSWLTFRFSDDTTVSMAGRARLGISKQGSQDVLRLEHGTISVKASPRSPDRMLRVRTPTAEAEVLGTQFNVQVSEEATRIVVNEGRVRVTRLADGRTEEVEADEVLVAALEQGASFQAVPRRAFVQRWESVLPQDLFQGRYEAPDASNSVGGARAMPHLWKGEPGQPVTPILLYTTVFIPSPKRAAPFRIPPEARLRVQGRMEKTRSLLQLGFAVNTPQGGLAGKYSVPAGTPLEPDATGHFSVELELASFLPETEGLTTSAAGQEVVYLWIQTVKVDAGLVIESVQWGP